VDPRTIPRILTHCCVALAAMCVALALRHAKARAEADCWRAIVIEGEWPPEGDCRPA